ncbi:SMC family ATPase [Paludicola sp. MB14-C6]|uniref:AAA family ATPase n=1 Tax=Paludihabitans sp. MB14-C6 TaxID=3070656 RepID=UPI0027DE27A6|nr:SMC family ATPase [Paludicola sp. MB14-C6]WMJ23096.1 SMC family ATPase [Paludicola sp. MB14-C6]
MIPIKLEFEAFGPFAQKQAIDFRNFENERLFLISGQTGSGKTTIFDAITFSLYGQASGYTRQSDTFKSDFADESTISYVSFDFIVKGKQYSIRREPMQFRKKRNNNIVKENSTATLTLENGEILSGVATVDKYIEELLGITVDQFKKIVMLPQGEFRRFLSDDSSEKQKILRKIFGTKILDDFTEQLRVNTNQIKSSLETTYTECATYINSISCLDNHDLATEVTKSEKNILSTLTLLKSFNQELTIQTIDLKETITKLNKQKEELNIPYFKEINAKFTQLEKTQNDLLLLQQQKDTYQSKEKELALLKKIKDILPLYQAINETTNKLNELEQKQTQYQEHFHANKELLDQSEAEYTVAKSEQNFVPEYLKKIENLKSQLEVLQEIESLKNGIDHILLEQEKLTENENALVNFKTYVSLSNQKEEVNATINKLSLCKKALSEYQNSAKRFLSQKNNYQAVFHQFINGQASLLAKNLVDGEMCPVCGSTKHPKPAQTNEALISQEILNQAKQAYEVGTQELEQAQAKLILMLKENHIEETELNPSHILVSIEQKEKEYVSLVSNLDTEINSIHLRNDLSKISPLPKIEGIDKKINEIQRAVAIQKEKLENVQIQIATNTQKVLHTSQTKEDIIQQIDTLQTKVNKISASIQTTEAKRSEYLLTNERLLEAIAQNKQSQKELKVQYEKNKAEFDKKLEALCISEQTFTEKLITINRIAALENEISEYKKNISVKTELNSSLREQLAGLSPINMDALQEQSTKIESEIAEKNDIYIRYTSSLHTNSELYQKLNNKQHQYEKQSKQFSQINKLFEVANGKYSDKLNFERYVLATYFNDVITNANLRLEQMTSSRYTLIRRAEKEKGNKSSGLSLDVFDTYTGKTRHVNTLSGGESFKIALALALGMADIISQNSGGIELNTLFIDEGFGSLDSHSLDQAIECLNDLRSSGRYIGIISHVNELKEKIPAKINVLQQPTGSYIE